MSFPFTVPLTAREVRTPTSTQRAPLGTRGMTPDGRIFRYAQAGATALVKGLLVQAEVAATQWQNATFGAWSTAFLTELGTTYVPTGTTYLHLTATGDSNMTLTKDYFKEGWVWVSGTATNGGQMMKIATNNVASSGSTGYGATGGQLYVQFEAGYALSQPIDTAAEISMTKSLYKSVVVAVNTSPTAPIVGVPTTNVAASYYFWLQTWGICAIKMDATVLSTSRLTNTYVVNSSSVDGALTPATESTDFMGTGTYVNNQIFVGVGAGSSGKAAFEASTFPLVHLTIAP